MNVGPHDQTPVELRDGRWYKREDLHRNAYGVNGAKYRACRHMMTRAILDGYEHVVSAQSVRSPQASICATLAEELGIGCTIVYGSSKPETAFRHPNARIAREAGAEFDFGCRSAFNTTLQPYGARIAEHLGAWQLPYAISMPDDSLVSELEEFLEVGAEQVKNLPDEIRTIVIPFGSGNTAAGILYGLSRLRAPEELERVVLLGIGPDRSPWLKQRLERVGARYLEFEVTHLPLHGWFANYSDSMPETVDGIEMHPTYEGKAIRFLDQSGLPWWDRRDGSTLFWVVGGPVR